MAMYSIDVFSELYSLKQDGYDNTNYFWKTLIDNIPSKHIELWGERLAKSKYLSDIDPEVWMKVCNILHWHRQSNFFTKKQKRYVTMAIVECWNDLEVDYVL